MRLHLLVGVTLITACSSGGDSKAPGAGGAGSSDGGSRPPSGAAGGASETGDAAPDLDDPAWRTLPPLAGGIRQEHAVVALGGRVCVIGGFAPGISDSVECYDPADPSWNPVTPLPEPLHHANAAVVDGRILVLGYMVDLAFGVTGASWAYDPTLATWEALAAMPAGRERGSAGVAVVGTEVYVIGGANGGSLAFVDVYDAQTNTWREGPPIPAPREHMCAGTVGDLVVVAGGRSDGIVTHTDVVLTLEPGGTSWREVAPIPTSRGGCAGATLAGRFHVFGGEGNADDPSGVFADAEAYDPVTDVWHVLPPMPVPRHGFGAATVGGVIYLPGGATQQAFGAVDDVEAFSYGG